SSFVSCARGGDGVIPKMCGSSPLLGACVVNRGAGFTGAGTTRCEPPLDVRGVDRCEGALCDPAAGGFGVATRGLEPSGGGVAKDGPDVEECVTGGGLVCVPVDGAASGADVGVVLCAVWSGSSEAGLGSVSPPAGGCGAPES